MKRASSFLLAAILAAAGCDDDEPPPLAIPTGALPPGWAAAALVPGASMPTGLDMKVGHESGRFGLRARGTGIHPTGAGDQHAFVYRKVQGNQGITARVISADRCGDRGSFGVILRPTLEGDSAYVLSAAAGASGLAQQGRVFQGTVSVPLRLDTDTPLPIWLRVERQGFSLLAAHSTDGQNWVVKTIASPLPPELYLGLVASSHSPDRVCGAVFDSVTIDDAKLPLPMPSVTQLPDAGAPPDAAAPPDAGPRDAGAPDGAGPPPPPDDGGVANDGGAAGGRPPMGMQPGGGMLPGGGMQPGGGMMPMQCHMLPFGIGVDPRRLTIPDYSPYPNGGALKDGVYFLTANETYTGPGGQPSMSMGPAFQTVIAVSAGAEANTYVVEFSQSIVQPSGQAFGSRSTQRMTRRGSSMVPQSLCPQMGEEGTPIGYGTQGDDLMLFSVGRQPSGAPSVSVTRYTRQPQIRYEGAGKAPVLPPDAGAP